MDPIFDNVILITGVTGYVGSHIAKQLMNDGRMVRGTVRSLKSKSKIDDLKKALGESPRYPLELVEADLTKDDGWIKAMNGCSAVIHVASPYPNITKKKVKEDDLIIPAREGTLRVLRAASNTPSIERVVLTSSCAAIFSDFDFKTKKVFTERDWTDERSKFCDVYSKSKTLAEKCAWEFVINLPAHKKFDLAVINPSLIFGPALIKHHKSSTSVSFIADVLNRKSSRHLRLCMPTCDVRDVARAHVEALTNPDAVNNRHIINTRLVWMKEWGTILRKEFKYQGFNVPTKEAPYILLWFMGLFNKQIRNVVIPRLGKEIHVDNARMRTVLGIIPTPIEDSLIDMGYSMLDVGIVDDPVLTHKRVPSSK